MSEEVKKQKFADWQKLAFLIRQDIVNHDSLASHADIVCILPCATLSLKIWGSHTMHGECFRCLNNLVSIQNLPFPLH